MRTKKEMFKEIVETMTIKEVNEPIVHSETGDRILNSVQPQFAGLAVRFPKPVPV